MRDLEAILCLACLWEATARKPGNVHPGASFADLSWTDFAESAEAAAPWLARAAAIGVGAAVLEAIRATRQRVATNTNLGIALLLAPLAAVPPDLTLRAGIRAVLENLSHADAVAVYEAIRLAQPGGLGKVDREDVSHSPTGTLREVMSLAADRDLIAKQYVTEFALVLDGGERLASLAGIQQGHAARQPSPAPAFVRGGRSQGTPDSGGAVGSAGITCSPTSALILPAAIENAIIYLDLELLSRNPDSLIQRKCGPDVASEASRRAAEVLASGDLDSPDGQRLLAEFDGWLRADGHRRNPGTTADLIAACLFAWLRDGVNASGSTNGIVSPGADGDGRAWDCAPSPLAPG